MLALADEYMAEIIVPPGADGVQPSPADTFGRYFEGHIERISDLSFPLHKRVLLSALIDSLAGARFPSNKNKERFLKMARECFGWDSADRVSVQQVLLRLKASGLDTRLPAFERLQLVRMQPAGIYALTKVDPDIGAVMDVVASDLERRMVRESSHAELFYAYRNSLVHEFRGPGHAVEFDELDFPHYQTRIGSNYEPEWELAYPLSFFFQCARNSVSSVTEHFRQSGDDPFSRYDFGSIWKLH